MDMRFERWMRASTATIALGALALGATACGDDDSAASAATAVSTSGTSTRPIADRGQWCAIVGVVDNQMAAVERSDVDFATRQVRYANIRTHVRRLGTDLSLVDDDVRGDVGALLGFTDDLLTTAVESADQATADARIEAMYAEIPSTFGEHATRWISSNCGVDID
jgi:hypothetical protein